MKIQALIALLFVPLGSLSAQVAIFERDFGQPTGNVVVLGRGTRPPSLQDIQLLPIDVVGRTHLSELLPESTRRQQILNAARLILPGENGSLYRYRRDAHGGTSFGYFLVAPDGDARTVLEIAGTGPQGVGDPLTGRVAVGPGGTSLLVATSKAAGGDLIEIDLVAAKLIDRTPDLPPLDFEAGGLALLGTWGVGVSEQGVFRFPRLPGGRAREVTLPSHVPLFGPDVVTSADQSTVAFLGGDTVFRQWVFTCGASGAAVKASDLPMPISGAGFLPEEPSGPTLALSTDGSWVAWRRDGSSNECFVRPTRTTTAGTDVQLTGPSLFDNTLNDTGVIAFFNTKSLTFVVGRRENDGIGRADVFRVDLGAGPLAVTNLTRTSGITAAPFDYGSLKVSSGLFQLPGAQPSFVGFDRTATGRLVRFDATGAVEVLLDRVASLDAIELTGDHLVAEVMRPAGVDDPLEDSLNLVQFPVAGSGAAAIHLPGCRVSRESALPTRNVFTGVLELEAGGEWLGRLAVSTGIGAAQSTSPREYGPTTGMTSDGAIFATMRVGARQVFIRWTEFGTQTLRSSPGGSFILPAL